MTQRLGKRKRGRPPRPMPEPIPDTPERIAWAIMQTPPKTEWDYLQKPSDNPPNWGGKGDDAPGTEK